MIFTHGTWTFDMFIDDPTFYYWLVFGSLINYISGTIVFVPIYFKLRQENYKRNLRIVALDGMVRLHY